jgi:hypothetical protein
LVLRPKPRNRRSDFEAQITKPELSVLRPKPGNPPQPWFWGSTKKPTASFEAKPGETIATSFEAKLEKTIAAGFEAKPAKTVTTGFEAKPLETVQVVLRPNHSQTVTTGFEAKPAKTVQVVFKPIHSQTVDLGFEAQPINTRSLSPRAQCRPHTAPPDHSTARPPSTRPMRPSSILCTRSPTPATILVAARHAAPGTCTPRDKQTWFSKRNKGKRKKMKLSRIWIQTSPSQWLITIKPRNWPLGFSISPLMSPLITKAQSLKYESKTSWSIARRPKKSRKAPEGHLEEEKPQKPTKGKKSGKAKQNSKEELRKAQKSKKSLKSTQKFERVRKAQNQHRSSKEQEKLKINTKAQNLHSPEVNSP